MNKKEIAEELVWIYKALQNKEGIYLLENVVDNAKSYSVADVHEWGKDNIVIYEKVKDLIKVRIFEAVERGSLDKVLASEILKTYYYKPFSDAGDTGKGETIFKIEILSAEADL